MSLKHIICNLTAGIYLVSWDAHCGQSAAIAVMVLYLLGSHTARHLAVQVHLPLFLQHLCTAPFSEVFLLPESAESLILLQQSR